MPAMVSASANAIDVVAMTATTAAKTRLRIVPPQFPEANIAPIWRKRNYANLSKATTT